MKRKIKFVVEKEEEEEENTSPSVIPNWKQQLSHGDRSSSSQVDGFSAEWRDWSGLPIHLLYDIADNLTDIHDSIFFGRVCGSWQSVSAGIMNKLGSPLLLIASPDGNDNKQQRALYSPSTDTISNLRTQLPHTKICRGFSFGWLITMEQKNYHIQLRNIFLNREINLPTLDNIAQLHADRYASLGAHEFLYKAALSSDPSSSNRFIVMGIMTRYMGLAFLKPGDQFWTSIPGGLGLPGMPWRFNDNVIYVDIIFFHRAKQFYTVLLTGVLIAIDFQGDYGGEPKLIQVAPRLHIPLAHCTDEVYLVEDFDSGDLLQVRKRRQLTKMDENRMQHKFIRFMLFKFDHMKLNWIEIHNLGGKVLFVGCNSSLLSSASDCPGCKPNCIYYVTDPHSSYARSNPRKFYNDPPYGGIYNLKDGTVQPNYLSTTVDKMLPLSIWIDPTLSKKPT